MCDTVVALGDATADGSVIFGKNSDRDPNEAHMLVTFPRAQHAPGSSVRCTYIDVPQVAETNAILLAKPFWLWGAEMGANEHGVVIGNEAVWTRLPYEEGPGLLGMDFIRLALERAATAREAVDVITSLLGVHGQGGSCRFDRPYFYHNSFLIADPHSAWVLETAGRAWVAQQVTGVRSISNCLTIGRDWDLASDGVVEYAIAQGWCSDHADFDWARCYGDPDYLNLPGAYGRHACSTERLQRDRGHITPTTMMAVLRDHGASTALNWTPLQDDTRADVCMHAAHGPYRAAQTTGSMVSHLLPTTQMHWLTGTAAPCLSVFKPVWLDAGLPATGPAPDDHYDAATLWWRHEALHRAVLRNYATLSASFLAERDALEASFAEAAAAQTQASAGDRFALSSACFAQADQALERWTAGVDAALADDEGAALYDRCWQEQNQRAGMPDPRSAYA